MSENTLTDFVDRLSNVSLASGDAFLAHTETQEARVMLAMLQRYDISEGAMERGARAAYTRWFDEQAKRMPDQVMQGTPPGAPVREAMATEMIEQLKVLNGGQDISADAQEKIRELLADGDVDSFVAAMQANRLKVINHENTLRAASREELKNLPLHTGIMATIAEDAPLLERVSAKHVDISPVAQAQGNEFAAMRAIIEFNHVGNEAQYVLGRLRGVPANQLDGLPHVRGPDTSELRNEFWGSSEQNSLITDALVERGVVSFGDPENAEARAAWNAHMAEALSGEEIITDPQELLDHMRELAEKEPGITMASEKALGSELSPGERTIERYVQKDFIIRPDNDADRMALAKEFERVFEENPDVKTMAELFDHMKEFLDEHPGIKIMQDNIDRNSALIEMGRANPNIHNEFTEQEIDQMIDARVAEMREERVMSQTVVEASADIDDPRSAHGALSSTPSATGVEYAALRTAGDVTLDMASMPVAQAIRPDVAAEYGVKLAAGVDLGVKIGFGNGAPRADNDPGMGMSYGVA